MAKSLYICYFGVEQPLVQTQVIPYLRELVKGGHEISLLTFEAETLSDDSAVETELMAHGIRWHRLRYHKRPSLPATIYDIVNGARFIRKLARSGQFHILHARSHVPMMMAALARRGMRSRPKLLGDIRGFMPEEYVDAGLWPEGGIVYRGVKRAESWLMKEADGFVLLTEAAKRILSGAIGERPIEVIPCCVDLKRFESANESSRTEYRQKLGIGDRFVLTYVGAFGGWYLTEETAYLFGALKQNRPDAFALILTQSDPKLIEPLLIEHGYKEEDYFVAKVPSAEIPKYLSTADAAVSFIKECYSKKASSPTKNAEYLACGLPILINDGIGDTTELTVEDGVGVVVEGFSPSDYVTALTRLEEMMLDRTALSLNCRNSALKRFDLHSVGGLRYNKMYDDLVNRE